MRRMNITKYRECQTRGKKRFLTVEGFQNYWMHEGCRRRKKKEKIGVKVVAEEERRIINHVRASSLKNARTEFK